MQNFEKTALFGKKNFEILHNILIIKQKRTILFSYNEGLDY